MLLFLRSHPRRTTHRAFLSQSSIWPQSSTVNPLVQKYLPLYFGTRIHFLNFRSITLHGSNADGARNGFASFESARTDSALQDARTLQLGSNSTISTIVVNHSSGCRCIHDMTQGFELLQGSDGKSNNICQPTCSCASTWSIRPTKSRCAQWNARLRIACERIATDSEFGPLETAFHLT